MKFEKGDKTYLSARKEFSTKYGERDVWQVMDHWPLYVGNANLQRVLAVYELIKSTLHVPGHIAEFGSWRGANIMFIAKVLNILDPHSNKLVYSFDSFEGLTEFNEKDINAVSEKGAYKGSLEELKDLISLYELNDNISIQKGYIENTLPALMALDPALSFSFVYCDTDLYSSTKIILDLLHPRMMIGGLFVFDEWNHPKWPGETAAVKEFLDIHSSNYEIIHIKNTRQPTLALKKISFSGVK